MKKYTVPLKVLDEEKVRSGVLACPESFMGKIPVYVYYDSYADDFFSATIPPHEMMPECGYEYIVTLWPRDRNHLEERFAEVVSFHRSRP